MCHLDFVCLLLAIQHFNIHFQSIHMINWILLGKGNWSILESNLFSWYIYLSEFRMQSSEKVGTKDLFWIGIVSSNGQAYKQKVKKYITTFLEHFFFFIYYLIGKNPDKKNVVASGIHHTRNEFPLIQLKMLNQHEVL